MTDTDDVEISEDAAVAIVLGTLGVITCAVLVVVWRWEFIAGVLVAGAWAYYGYKNDAAPIGGDSSA